MVFSWPTDGSLSYFAAGLSGQSHHLLGNFQVSAVVNADFSDYERRRRRRNFSI